MKGILAAVFCGVFVGALGYELLNRTRPEVVEEIRKKVADGLSCFLGTCDSCEDLDDFDSDFSDDEVSATA